MHNVLEPMMLVTLFPSAHSTIVPLRSSVIEITLREELAAVSLPSVRDDINLPFGPQVSGGSWALLIYIHTAISPPGLTLQRVTTLFTTQVNLTSSPGHISSGPVN